MLRKTLAGAAAAAGVAVLLPTVASAAPMNVRVLSAAQFGGATISQNVSTGQACGNPTGGGTNFLIRGGWTPGGSHVDSIEISSQLNPNNGMAVLYLKVLDLHGNVLWHGNDVAVTVGVDVTEPVNVHTGDAGVLVNFTAVSGQQGGCSGAQTWKIVP
ncbi:hypothetical protein ACGFMK_13830 [Amycolatopsis sp. NPDC049252]|uniref:hypothetical protein n=1 Tax=Amycolatopsis sp. NPDC049252 TaxID=3363933 RepID=UPI00371960AD